MPRDGTERDQGSVFDIHIAATRITLATKGVTPEQYSDDWRLQSIVLHPLLVLGEAAKRVSQDYCAAHPEVPWNDMARTRDRVIHGYDDIDPIETWRIVNSEIPRLLVSLAPLLPRE